MTPTWTPMHWRVVSAIAKLRPQQYLNLEQLGASFEILQDLDKLGFFRLRPALRERGQAKGRAFVYPSGVGRHLATWTTLEPPGGWQGTVVSPWGRAPWEVAPWGVRAPNVALRGGHLVMVVCDSSGTPVQARDRCTMQVHREWRKGVIRDVDPEGGRGDLTIRVDDGDLDDESTAICLTWLAPKSVRLWRVTAEEARARRATAGLPPLESLPPPGYLS